MVVLGFWLYRRSRNGHGKAGARKVVVVGAGLVGQNMVKQLQRFGWADFDVAGYLDDDPAKQKQLIGGLPVLRRIGTSTRIGKRAADPSRRDCPSLACP